MLSNVYTEINKALIYLTTILIRLIFMYSILDQKGSCYVVKHSQVQSDKKLQTIFNLFVLQKDRYKYIHKQLQSSESC